MKIRNLVRLGTYCLALGVMALSACKGIDLTPSLPAETQEGKNTFGCMLNDELWLTYTEHTLDRAIEPEADSGWFAVQAEREIGNFPRMYLTLADSTGLHTKTYTHNEGFHATVNSSEAPSGDVYMIANGGEGSITLTKAEAPARDGSKQVIIAGRFSFTAKSSTTGKTIVVKDGRFDVKAR